ncbi:hypothetical protein B1A99_25345 [Cohnella sp. CIP 111063]|jgi:hypothetical protein|uniref:hypothetical protein n=1 Tax=unclassified Cohnella TaxID=2636738 RepID=UPI000B8BFE98|nr:MULTISPECIES: hypothetical protein [unclassified Cohnella]OXS54660.1 hypothetical protein B1A99_25345 [Cohnella sp. CIP 111063]PRX64487.1 hypothetical protein B0G52_11925 [Cohnella sp. SGD-V74]
MSLSDIQDQKRGSDASVRFSIDHSVNLFRALANPQQDLPAIAPPRDSDEIKALNALARRKLLTAMRSGEVKYDAERRVLTIAKYTRLKSSESL